MPRHHEVKACSQPEAFVGGEVLAHRLEVGDVLVAETFALVEEFDLRREDGEFRGAGASGERLDRSADPVVSRRKSQSSPSVSSIISWKAHGDLGARRHQTSWTVGGSVSPIDHGRRLPGGSAAWTSQC
jgi:hypothetical protein